MNRSVLTLLLGSALLAGCDAPLQPASPQASPAAIAACRDRADEVYLRQHRDAIYRSDTYTSAVRDSPYAGAGPAGPTEALSAQYGRNQDARGCINGAAQP